MKSRKRSKRCSPDTRRRWLRTIRRPIFDVVSRAYERTSLIVTTNLPFESWVDVMGSERLTGALLDRLTHRVHIIEANGESFRLRESKRRQRRRTARQS